MQPNEGQPIETLRMTARDRKRLLEVIERQGAAHVAHERRALRVQAHELTALVTLYQPTGAKICHRVVPRNLSRRGMGFVHGRFIYPDTEVDVALTTLDGESLTVHGKLVRCRHIGGIAHEASIVFDVPLDLNHFVTLSEEEQEHHENDALEDERAARGAVEDESEFGTALIIDNNPADRKLFGHFLTSLGMNTAEANGTGNVLAAINKTFFATAIVEMRQERECGEDIIRYMRTVGFRAPIIACSADDSQATQDKAFDAGADSFLPKPFSKQELREVVEGALQLDLGPDASTEPIASLLADDPEMQPLIKEFIASLGAMSLKLRQACSAQDFITLQTLCRQLKGAGSGYGYPAVTDAAREVLIPLHTPDPDIEAIRPEVNRLLALLRRIHTA